MIRFSDVYVKTMARGLCEGDEQFVSASAGSYQSFWTFKIPLFRHDYLFIATTLRLFIVDHRKGFAFDRMDRVDSFRWSDIGSVKVNGIFTKRLVIKDQSNRTLVQARLPKLLAQMFGLPIANNTPSIQALVSAWEQRRQLGAAPVYGQLPAAASVQPQAQSYGQMPQAQPYGQQPQSYAPPPPAQPYAPPPQQFAPPAQYAAPPPPPPPGYTSAPPPPPAARRTVPPPPPPPQRSQAPLPQGYPPAGFARPAGTTYSRPS